MTNYRKIAAPSPPIWTNSDSEVPVSGLKPPLPVGERKSSASVVRTDLALDSKAASSVDSNSDTDSVSKTSRVQRPRGSGSMGFMPDDYFPFDMGTEKGVAIKGELLNPFRFPKHEGLVTRLNEAVAEWVLEMGLMQGDRVLEKITKARFCNLVAGPCSELSEEKAVVNALFVAFLFFYDDKIDQVSHTIESVKTLNANLKKAFEVPQMDSQDPLIRSISSFRIKADEAGLTLGKFKRTLYDYFLTAEAEIHGRELGEGLDLLTYLSRREISGAVYAVFQLAIASSEIVIPEAFDTAIFTNMVQHAVRAICIANDIYSYRKECMEDIPDNLVFVIQKERDWPLSTALNEVISVHDKEVRCYLTNKEFMRNGHSETDIQVLNQLCKIYEGWMNSNQDFSSTSMIYVLPST